MTDAQPDFPFDRVAQAWEGAAEEAMQAWSRSVSVYSSYIEALSKARAPEDLVAAQARFIEGSVEAFGQSAARMQKLYGVDTAPKV